MEKLNWMARIVGGGMVVFIALINLTLAADSLHQPLAVQTAYQYDASEETSPYSTPNTLAFAGGEQGSGSEQSTQNEVAQLEQEEGYVSPTPPPAGPQPWRIPQPCLLQAHGIAMGGWIQQGITGVDPTPNNRSLGPLATNDRANEYQLNQAWLYLDRPVNNEGEGWDWGGRIDLTYGTDWRFANTNGLENKIDASQQLYGLALPQFYFDLAYNKLTMRFGHWGPSVGIELVPSVANFFYSHSYGMAYCQPLLVTGMLGKYQLTEQWSFNAGLNRGWYQFEDTNNDWDVMGGVEWLSPNKKTSVRFNLDSGKQDDPFGLNNRFVYTLALTQKITEKWSYALENDYGKEDNAPVAGSNAYWYGITNYLFYTINPRWSAGMRVEWIRDNNGARIFGIGTQPNIRGWAGGPGFVGDFTELTLGANWRPNPNTVLRPEVRLDSYNGSTDVNNQLPFNDGTRSYQFTFAADLILTF